MRKLALKLTLAFLFVGVIGALLVAIIVQQRAQTAFNQFVLDRNQQILVDSLIQYYQSNGGWNGIAESLAALQNPPQRPPRRGDIERYTSPDWINIILVSQDKTILYSPLGEQIGQLVKSRDLNNAVPLENAGENIGWLLLASGRRAFVPDSAESIFLRNLNNAALLSALIASLLALGLGSLLAFTLTRTLLELKVAANEIAKGKFGGQVKVRSKDELGELAESFNQMSLELDQATQARRQMTADIAHDLRSPLSVISGYAEALSDGKIPGDAEIYNVLYQQTRHLNRLVEDLRTLSLADAGELPLTIQAIDPGSLIKRTASAFAGQAEAKKINLKIEIEPDLPEVQVDVERMAQVLGNLMGNALRYTPINGQIYLSAIKNDRRIILGIQDTGPGIAADDLPYIFERSYRGDKARQQVEGETGLGLAIAKSLVEAQGGEIVVESEVGAGTKFSIVLPYHLL